ncbi:MAG: cobalamin biosynthesis protein [Stenomitos rutilans HA7619-LM2]|jgi:cobalt-precorrin 5A hydrolase/precorrin-3B C17-methyltransferase|nr:cobalamin biosynthesis protein [Stenomitos rutilans HA7619-LM2]
MASSTHAVPEEPLPRIFWVGIGCKQGTAKGLIEQAIRAVFRAYTLHEGAIAGVATIDTKANEAGLLAFCRDRHLPLCFYPVERLRSVTVPNASSAIEAAVGTPSVAEAAALLACGEGEAGEVDQGITAETQRRRESNLVMLSTRDTLRPKPVLCVPKQCYRSMDQKGAMTIAVARSAQHS